MSAKLSIHEIQSFWTEQARQHGESHQASWSDLPVINLEIRQILNYLHDGDRVLDVGCANGFSTVQFATARKADFRGVDFIPEMIVAAQARLSHLTVELAGRIEFCVGNVLALDEASASYDKVVVIRVLINLGDWEHQVLALRECARVLKPGGVLLLSEATVQGWQRLNSFRVEWGLDEIPMPAFNTYLDETKVLDAARATGLELAETVNFASTYYVGTRVLKPLLAKALGVEGSVADPGMHWNRWFSQLPQAGDYGTQKLLVLRKI